jgi:hypothetical protein
MKRYLLGLTILTFVGCSTTDDNNDGGNTTTPPPVTTPGEETPIHVNSEGQKIGTIKLMDDKSVWVEDAWHGDAQACQQSAAVGGVCDPNVVQSCKLPDGKKLACRNTKLWKIYGWVSERKDGKFVPLSDVKLDVFWMAGCLVGICNPQVPAVSTNSNGYFELYTPTLNDTLRINGKEGYFGLCKGTTPINGGGQSIYEKKPGDPIGPFVQHRKSETSCKYGTP